MTRAISNSGTRVAKKRSCYIRKMVHKKLIEAEKLPKPSSMVEAAVAGRKNHLYLNYKPRCAWTSGSTRAWLQKKNKVRKEAGTKVLTSQLFIVGKTQWLSGLYADFIGTAYQLCGGGTTEISELHFCPTLFYYRKIRGV